MASIQPRWPGDVLDNVNSAMRVNMVAGTLTTGDIELGAVELKNGTDDTRAVVTASNALKVDLTSTAANATAIKVDGSAVTQPVSGTVTSQVTNSFSNLKANATTTVKSGAGVLHSISVNTKGIGNTITVYDNTAGSGTTIATLDSTLGQDTLLYDVAFATGLTIVIAGGTAADITVSYR